MIRRDRKGEPTLSPAERRRMLALFRPYRGRLGAVLALIGLSAGLGMISPFLLRGVLDERFLIRTRPCLPSSSSG